MKKRKFNKRLALNKSTVANLDISQMGDVKGGDTGLSECVCIKTYPPVCGTHTCYNCTTADPNQICPNTCNCTDGPTCTCVVLTC